MKIVIPKQALIAGILLILATNIIVIAGALSNRSGEPDSNLVLTERELPMQTWGMRENSGLNLRLNWNSGYHPVNNDWIDKEKLIALSFDMIDSDDEAEIRRHITRLLPRPVYIVLEFDGPAYQAAVEAARTVFLEETELLAASPDNEMLQNRLKATRRNLNRLLYSASRLYTVDAGRDAETLRRRYPDRSRYMITTGLIRAAYNPVLEEDDPWGGYVSRLNINSIHVGLEFRDTFDSLPERRYVDNYSPLPRYRVELAWGRRYEPWIISASGLVPVAPE